MKVCLRCPTVREWGFLQRRLFHWQGSPVSDIGGMGSSHCISDPSISHDFFIIPLIINEYSSKNSLGSAGYCQKSTPNLKISLKIIISPY
jgi:hypothetical protein